MEWFKKHTDAIIILGAMASSMLWMNHQFNMVNNRFVAIEKDMAVIKTVLLMKQILPPELALKDEKK